MGEERTKTLVIKLFPRFENPKEVDVLERLLWAAGVRESVVATLNVSDRNRNPSYVQTWLRYRISQCDGKSVVFIWPGKDEPDRVISKLETLNGFVIGLAEARKVLMVEQVMWGLYVKRFNVENPSLTCFAASYKWKRLATGVESQDDLLLLRSSGAFKQEDAKILGEFLHTLDSRPGSDDSPPFQVGVPLHRRDDETTQEVPVDETSPSIRLDLQKQSAKPTRGGEIVETMALRSCRPDPRRDDEDERPTIEPPAPSSPPEREDPTRPR